MNDERGSKTVGILFLIGFASGAIFSYSGMLTFLAGMTTGIVLARSEEYDQYLQQAGEYILNRIRTMVQSNQN